MGCKLNIETLKKNDTDTVQRDTRTADRENRGNTKADDRTEGTARQMIEQKGHRGQIIAKTEGTSGQMIQKAEEMPEHMIVQQATWKGDRGNIDTRIGERTKGIPGQMIERTDRTLRHVIDHGGHQDS